MDKKEKYSHLTDEQADVLWNKATEKPYSGEYVDETTPGTYTCAACGHKLFDSETKYDSHCGWPSFYDIKETGSVKFKDDSALGMKRTEVVCANCGGHLGHVFDDGPEDKTGKRYCINSLALNLEEK